MCNVHTQYSLKTSGYAVDDFLSVIKAVSDQNRVRALLALRNGELCACQIIELLDLAPSTVSKHMLILKQARLVLCRKEERWIYYRLPNQNECNELIRDAISWIFKWLESDEKILSDQSTIKKITKQNLLQLCKK